MISRLLKFILLISLVFTIACKSSKTNGSKDSCKTSAMVKDFTGLDGCGLMIVLDNGDKLLPAKINDENFALKDGQKIRLNYSVIEGVASICMAEKASIEITCIELVENAKPIIPECYDTNEPAQVEWMKKIMDANKPLSIQKYPFRTDGWAYLFMFGSKQVLYDCQGNLLCEHEGLGVNQCKAKYLANERGKVIYRSTNNR